MRHFKTQLKSAIDGAIISATGGKVYVTAAGGTAKATLYTAAGASLANPVALTNGSIEFNTADAVASVDLYIQTPTGHFVVQKGVKSSGDASLFYNNKVLDTTFVIPFNIADTAAATETATGFTIPGAVQPNVAVDVVAIDATETIDVGTLASASGDADGFLALLDIGTLGYIKPTISNGTPTLGAKLYVQDSANSGDESNEQDISQIGKQVTYTLTAGSDTGAGFIVLPMQLRPSLAL